MADEPQPNPDHVTITKADLATLQRVYRLANTLWGDPEVGVSFQERAKKIDPNLRTDHEQYAHVLNPITTRLETAEAERKALAEQLEKDRQERADEKALDKLGKDIDGAQRRYRLTDEAMPEVKRRMLEEGISSPYAAAALVASEIEPAKVVNGTNFAPMDLNVLGMDGKSEDVSMKSLHADPVKWQDEEIGRIMAEDADAA